MAKADKPYQFHRLKFLKKFLHFIIFISTFAKIFTKIN